MEVSYPVLEGLNSPGKYSGRLKVLSFLDVTQKGHLSSWPCGHKAARCMVLRPPRILIKPLEQRGLLGTVGVLDEVVVFDLERIQLGVAGHRERKLCPVCFFEKLFSQLDPTCPYCRRPIRDGEEVWLVLWKALTKRQQRRVKMLKVKYDSKSWALCCCVDEGVKQVHTKSYRWDFETRTLKKV